MKSPSAKRPFHSGIQGPLVPGAGIVLGAAGRQKRSAPAPLSRTCAGPSPAAVPAARRSGLCKRFSHFHAPWNDRFSLSYD